MILLDIHGVQNNAQIGNDKRFLAEGKQGSVENSPLLLSLL